MGFIQDLPYKIRDEIFKFPNTFNTLFTTNIARSYKNQQFSNIESNSLAEESATIQNKFASFTGPQLKAAGRLRNLRSEPALPKLCTDYQKSAPTLFRQRTRLMRDNRPQDLIIQLEDIEDDFLNIMRNPPPQFNSQLINY